jgi:hypothetical protein
MWTIEELGFNFWQRQDNVFFSEASRLTLRPNWPLLIGYQRHKAAGCDADHLLPSTAEVKNVWSYTSTLSYSFMA